MRETTALKILDDLFKRLKNKKEVTTQMEGMNVIANYGNYQIYRIDDIKWDMTPENQFDKDGKKVNYFFIIDFIYWILQKIL